MGGVADAVTGGIFDFSGEKKAAEKAQREAQKTQEKMLQLQQKQAEALEKKNEDAKKQALRKTENIKRSFRQHYSSVSNLEEDTGGILG